MAIPGTHERLQPSLLDRLLDDDPANPRVESLERQTLNTEQLRAAVLRDLHQLLNTVSWPETRIPYLSEPAKGRRPKRDWVNYISAQEYPEVAQSVINFGVPPMYGYIESEVNPARLQQLITQAIERFEPRISLKKNGVRVIDRAETHNRPNVIGIRIEGTLWAEPMPVELLLRTDLDLESREVTVTALAGGV